MFPAGQNMDLKKTLILVLLFNITLITSAVVKKGLNFDLDYYIDQNDPYYNAVCSAKDRCSTVCSTEYKHGCVCYNDGSCFEQLVSRCHQCTNPSVFAVFEGEPCPKRSPAICYNQDHNNNRHQHYRRHRWDRFNQNFLNMDDIYNSGRYGGYGEYDGYGGYDDYSRYGRYRRYDRYSRDDRDDRDDRDEMCPKQTYPTCICDSKNGCLTKFVNPCNECQKHSYVAMFINSPCPDSSLQATCNKTIGAYPPPTTCNQPQAYNCTFEDRRSPKCKLKSAPIACVCYANGTCISQPASSCSCQRPEILSVYIGNYCPNNCTGKAIARNSTEEENEETESESESEHENENEAESEGEIEAETESKSTPSKSTVSNCNYPSAYECQSFDRNAINCSNITSRSCVCRSNGTCSTILINKCYACLQPDVVSIFENGLCPTNCTNSSANPIPPPSGRKNALNNNTLPNLPRNNTPRSSNSV